MISKIIIMNSTQMFLDDKSDIKVIKSSNSGSFEIDEQLNAKLLLQLRAHFGKNKKTKNIEIDTKELYEVKAHQPEDTLVLINKITMSVAGVNEDELGAYYLIYDNSETNSENVPQLLKKIEAKIAAAVD